MNPLTKFDCKVPALGGGIQPPIVPVPEGVIVGPTPDAGVKVPP